MTNAPDWLSHKYPWYCSYVLRRPAGWLIEAGLVRVFGVVGGGDVRDSIAWNAAGWRSAFCVSDELFFWGENVFGDQFGIDPAGVLYVMRCEGGGVESVAEATFDDLVEVELARLHADSASLLEGVRRRGLWPSSSQHIGFALPLVVGGSCEIENVEIVDAEVHLAILAEIVAKTAAVANGAKITRFVD